MTIFKFCKHKNLPSGTKLNLRFWQKNEKKGGRGPNMTEYTKTKLSLRCWPKKWEKKVRCPNMTEYTKTKLSLRFWQKSKKKNGEGSKYDGIY